MPTVVGPWQGSSPRARIEIDYDVTYNADRTSAHFAGTAILATEHALHDSVNTWYTSGTFGAASGSTPINHGGAGRTGFWSFTGWRAESALVSANFTGLEGTGSNISADLWMSTGPLAPFTDGNYRASNITATSFNSSNIIANGNGGSLVDVQMQVNTSPSPSGALLAQAGSFRDVGISGLRRATLYFFRIRIANSTYGWGPWGPWRTATTLTQVPGAPNASWGFRNITQVDAYTTGLSVSDNGGLTLNNWQAQWNTTQSASGATTRASNSGSVDVRLTGLTPGTTYYVRVRAANTRGWGAWSAWKAFTTLPGVYVNVNGVWRNAIPFVNVNGTWRSAIRYVNVNGVWRQ